jgi:class 3 adenylate cyclase
MCGSPLLINDASRGAAAIQRVSMVLFRREIGRGKQPLHLVRRKLRGQRRSGRGAAGTTVIFADVKGSTELLERLGTEAWVEVMNNVFQVLGNTDLPLFWAGGTIPRRWAGGIFWRKIANEDDPEHATLAALAMQEALKPYAEELAKKEGIHLEMRVGVSTGEVIVANVGDSQYSEDTAMGEALTVAARMEASAEPGTVLVSDSTYRLVRNRFEWLPLGEMNGEGHQSPDSGLPAYRGETTRGFRRRHRKYWVGGQFLGLCPGNDWPQKRCQVLKKCVEDLYAGRGGITLVTGVKGMGKSSLVNHVRQHFNRQNALFAAAQSRETDQITG